MDAPQCWCRSVQWQRLRPKTSSSMAAAGPCSWCHVTEQAVTPHGTSAAPEWMHRQAFHVSASPNDSRTLGSDFVTVWGGLPLRGLQGTWSSPALPQWRSRA